jgi:hypothetical protein
MKKIGLILAVICLVLSAGLAFGNENAVKPSGGINDPDSLINLLDPSNAPAAVIPHTGLMGLTEEGLPGAKGSAAGGPTEVRDSLVNYLDPSYEPARNMPKKTSEAMRFDPGSVVHQISPTD